VQLERIDSLVKQGIAEGATLLAAGNCDAFARAVLQAHVFEQRVIRLPSWRNRNIFGPVLAAMTFRTPRKR